MKKIFALVFAAVAASMAQASYLYWQTSTENTFNNHNIAGYNIYATTGSTSSGGTALTVTYTDGETVSVGSTGYAKGGEYKIFLDDATYGSKNNNYNNYSFYVEVLGYDNAAFGDGKVGVIGTTSTPMPYADLVSKGSIVPSGLTKIPSMWTGGTVVAPEPTSGLLMLLGVAALGLKRRKA